MKSDVLRVVLIGAGGIGRFHAQLWRNIPQAKLVGVYDLSHATAQSVAHECGLERIYSSLEEALAEPTVDAVDICTPNRYHTPIVIAALEAGKHCLCEKPLALTTTEIEQMIAVRDRCGKLLMTAQHMRFEQSSVTLRRLIDAGRLGEVYYARAWWLRRRMAPTTPGLLTKEQAGFGPGLDLGVHLLDLTLHFMGYPEPTSITGVTDHKIAQQDDVANQWGRYQREDFQVEDFAAALIRFQNGAALSLETSWLLNITEPEIRRIWLHGTAGGALWPDLQINHIEQGLLLDTQIASETGGDGHQNELAAFCDAIRDDQPSSVPAEQSLRVARIIEGLYASAESGQHVVF